jgi:hypothetical protein
VWRTGRVSLFLLRRGETLKGILSLGNMLEERQYNKKVSIYGQVRSLGELECLCLHISSRGYTTWRAKPPVVSPTPAICRIWATISG